VNLVDPHRLSIIANMLPKMRFMGLGLLAMKCTMGANREGPVLTTMTSASVVCPGSLGRRDSALEARSNS
jgi:hypothetical protein